MSAVRFPSNVDREDRLVWGLTGRQLAEVAGGVVVAVLVRSMTTRAPLPLSAGVSAMPMIAALAVALGQHDGLGADRFLLAWLSHRRGSRLLVPAGDGILPAPDGCPSVRLPTQLDLPVRGVGEGGIVDLGSSGAALVCQASVLNFGLRTDEEQAALVSIMARWLNSLSSPVQILIHTEPVDVGHLVTEIEAGAAALAHPDLEAAALDHAQFLASLAARRNVLRRDVFLVFRAASSDEADRTGLHRRADEAIVSLATAGVVVQPLEGDDARAALARSANPIDPAPSRALRRTEDYVVRGADL